jgi:hypothetical protein
MIVLAHIVVLGYLGATALTINRAAKRTIEKMKNEYPGLFQPDVWG